MFDMSLRVRDDLVADSASYNMLMTTMLRAEAGPSTWGNWTLDLAVEPGMVGVLDPVAGTFERHKWGAIPLEVEVVEEVAPADWDFRSASVRPRPADSAEQGETWTFGESHTIVSRGAHHSRQRVADPVRVAEEQYDLLCRWADARGYATVDGILQGFGFVTATYQATSVLNVAARAPGEVRVSSAGVSGIGEVEVFRHDSHPSGGAARTVPYAFEFLSFSGRTVLPGWVGQIPSMTVSFHNAGSYVVQCTVTYDTPAARGLRKRVQVGCGIPGWVYLPLDATDLRVTCRFWHVDDWGPRHELPPVARPMQQWLQGQGAVEIQGWWPGDYGADWAS